MIPKNVSLQEMAMKNAIMVGVGLLFSVLPMTEYVHSKTKPAYTIKGCNKFVSVTVKGKVVTMRFPTDTSFKNFRTMKVRYVPGKQTVAVSCTDTTISAKVI
jgi:hypothetical protein